MTPTPQYHFRFSPEGETPDGRQLGSWIALGGPLKIELRNGEWEIELLDDHPWKARGHREVMAVVGLLAARLGALTGEVVVQRSDEAKVGDERVVLDIRREAFDGEEWKVFEGDEPPSNE